MSNTQVFTFSADYLVGGGVSAQVISTSPEKASSMLQNYEIPACGDEPAYKPFVKTKFRQLSSFYIDGESESGEEHIEFIQEYI